MLSLMGIPVCVYHAFGQTGVTDAQLLAVALMLFVSASYTPLPGASGAQEGGFLLYYQGIFAGGTLRLALLVWRFFTYYLYLLVGIADTIVTAIRRKHHPASGLRRRAKRSWRRKKYEKGNSRQYRGHSSNGAGSDEAAVRSGDRRRCVSAPGAEPHSGGVYRAMNREIAVYITRDGEIVDVMIGTHQDVELTDYRLRRNSRRLSCVRCIHTHPSATGYLSDVDISALRCLPL